MASLRLLTVDEVADLLRLSKPTIYKFVSRRQIPFVKLGGRLLFEPEKLTAWIQDRAVETDKT